MAGMSGYSLNPDCTEPDCFGGTLMMGHVDMAGAPPSRLVDL